MKNYNPRQGEYYDYLDQHINNVCRSYYQFIRSVIAEKCPEELLKCDLAIVGHDASKYDDAEFDAYCNYFYPCEGFEKDQKAFDEAWLHHQRNNPHHWQYWILVRDEGNLVPIDMTIPEIVGCVCDWHSFSAKDPTSTAANWYEKNKDKMIMSDFTREWVTFLLQYLTEPVKCY